MGYEKRLIPRCASIVAAFERLVDDGWTGGTWRYEDRIERQFDFGPDDAHLVHQLSDNHWKMGVCTEFARAAAWGTPGELEDAAKVVDVMLDRELREVGLWLHEQMAGGAHNGMHLEAHLVGLMGALRAKDGPRVARFHQVIQAFYRIASVTSTPGGTIVCIGERQVPLGPVLEEASNVWCIANGRLPVTPALRLPVDPKWHDTYHVAARAARALRARGAMPSVPVFQSGGDLPKLRTPLTVRRWRGGHSCSSPTLGWLQVDHVAIDHARGAGAQLKLVEWDPSGPSEDDHSPVLAHHEATGLEIRTYRSV
jgi:hypothetical protein